MLRMLIILFTTFSLHTQGHHLLISEIFANAPGHKSDRGKQWIEVLNQGEPILITHLTLTIHSGKTQELLFSENLSLSKSLFFNDYLVIAQNKTLGLSHCLKNESPILTMATFKIDDDEDPRICVTLNHDLQTCAGLSKKNKISDGVSLFRNSDDLNDTPLWRYEPCHLIDGVFASPGLPPIFCRDEKINIDAKLIPCKQTTSSLSQPIENSQNFFTRRNGEFGNQAHKVELTPNQLSFHLGTHRSNLLTVANICVAPINSEKICHIIDDINLQPAISRYQLALDTSDNDGKQYFLRIKTIDPAIKSIAVSQVKLASIDKKPLWRPDFSFIMQTNNLVVKIKLHEEDVPLNFIIKDINDVAIYQKAFLSPGDKQFSISKNIFRKQFYLIFSGASGDFFDEPMIFSSG